MQHKTFLFSFLFVLPTLFMGQVLQEIAPEPRGLPDPDQYPFEVFFKLGLPAGSFAYQSGYQNMDQILRDGGFDIPRVRQVNIFELGMRYKRFYAEIGGASNFISSPIPPFSNERFSINASSMMGYVDLGYSVWQNRNSALLLRLGIGQLGSSYDIRSLQNVSPLDFDDLLTEIPPNPSTLIYHENTFLDISAEFWKGRAKNRTSFGEAVKIGYRRGINETAWEAINTTPLNAPLDRMGEFYLNICFHLGYTVLPKSK
ncbi:MAG: hypothetical protein AB8H47_22780 [Bacteroidia bacterium]